MARLKLTLAVTPNQHTQPIIDGRVKADGIDLDISVLGAPEIFYRQLHDSAFDASEMSMSSLLIARSQGDERFVAIPVFTSRRFFHTLAVVRADAGINKPEDLKGKRVGVPEYQMTAALWSRAALQHEFGVQPSDIEWHMERLEDMSHGGATGFKPPAGVKFSYIPKEKNISDMLLSGELDAAVPFFGGGPNYLDRSKDLAGESRVRQLFDVDAEGERYFGNTGFFPINHGMVVRRSLYEQHPWVALNLFRAFLAAKELVRDRRRELVSPYFETGVVGGGLGTFNQDIFAYGVRSNQKILEAIAQFSHEQGLTPRKLELKELFAEQTMDL